MKNKKLLDEVIKKSVDFTTDTQVFVGFDGFIDEIIHVVKERKTTTEYDRIETINDFSERIAESAGLSGNIEFMPIRIKLGGNGPILANALMKLGYGINIAGALGKTRVHSVFAELAEKALKVISFADPGHTDALEFLDGKIMLGKVQHLEEINWVNLLKKIDLKHLTRIIEDSRLFALTNWTMLPGMNSILKGILKILPQIKHKPLLFLDLADPHIRMEPDLIEVLNLISQLEKCAPVILGLNQRESGLIAEVLNIEEDLLTIRSVRIREKLGLSFLLIHPVDGAVVATREESFWLSGPYTPRPLLTTGAGDNFNAGFCHGILAGLSPRESLVCGVSTAGFYVRNGYPPGINELVDFMRNWSQNRI